MPKHIFRLILLLAACGAVGLVAKSYFTANSFYRYGHYRGDSLAEIASDKPKYQAPESCGTCHAERYAEWSRGVHDSADIRKVVICEVCHGAGGGRDDRGLFQHSATGPVHPDKVKLAVPTDTTKLCTRCHAKDPARPAAQRQIVVATHAATKQCWSCHNPHSPRLLVGAAEPPAQRGDAAAWREKAALCAGCHGAQGISTNLPGPSLAAQNEAYLIEALGAYRSGARDNPMMSALAKGLSDSDIRNAAAYFSGLSCKRPPQAHAQTVSAVQGAASKCTACHGGTGVSGNPQWPNLAGQSKAYLIGALQAYKGGGRKNPIMNGIAKDLSDAEAERAAGFFALAGCE